MKVYAKKLLSIATDRQTNDRQVEYIKLLKDVWLFHMDNCKNGWFDVYYLVYWRNIYFKNNFAFTCSPREIYELQNCINDSHWYSNWKLLINIQTMIKYRYQRVINSYLQPDTAFILFKYLTSILRIFIYGWLR